MLQDLQMRDECHLEVSSKHEQEEEQAGAEEIDSGEGDPQLHSGSPHNSLCSSKMIYQVFAFTDVHKSRVPSTSGKKMFS